MPARIVQGSGPGEIETHASIVTIRRDSADLRVWWQWVRCEASNSRLTIWIGTDMVRLSITRAVIANSFTVSAGLFGIGCIRVGQSSDMRG